MLSILNVGMHTRNDLAKILGVSYAQLRDRLELLERADGLLVGQVRRGPKGRLEYTPAVLEMLREVEALVLNHGMELSQGVEEVRRKINGLRNKEVENVASNEVNLALKVELLEERLEDKERIIEELRRENEYLREKVDQLLPLALPRPRRLWWPFRRMA